MTTESYDTCHSCGGLVLEGAIYCSHCTTRHPLSVHPLDTIAKPLTVLASPLVKLMLFGIRQVWRYQDRETGGRIVRQLHT